MKKIIYSAMAVAMLATTSCKDDFAESFVGEEATVEFSISTPEIATRAYSDGLKATVLQYAIYDEAGNELTALTVDADDNKTLDNGCAKISLQLKNNKSYQMVVWAAAPEAPYSLDFENKKMTVDYATALSNDENRDAFYAYQEFTVDQNTTIDVKLKRPFAQLNIGAGDFTQSANSGYTPTKSYVKVPAYSTLNFADGSVDGQDVREFALNTIPVDEDFPYDPDITDAVKPYRYLAMNYILVGADQELVDIEFGHSNDNEGDTRTIGSVPVQRNYRTNIYGNILTSSTDINVEILPDYEVGTLVYDAQTLQDAINAATGETTIYLGADIKDDVTVIQKPGVKITIDGSTTRSNVSYNGTIKVHSNSNHYADAALTIKNVNFEVSEASDNVIEALENGSERYSTNIKVEGCTFTAEGEAENTAVGLQIKSSKNAKVIGCTATNMHSLIQAQSCDESVLVQECTVTGKNGVAFKQVKAATVEGCTITAAEYGIRFDGNTDNYGITVKDNNVTAAQPFIVRKMTGKDNTIATGTKTKRTM